MRNLTSDLTATRRRFSRASMLSLLAATAAASNGAAAFGQTAPASNKSGRREVLKERLPGEPQRELTLVEVTYPASAGSPPHSHPSGVAAFVVAGSVASKVGDGPERIYHAGEAWYEPAGAIHRVSRNASSSQPATLLAIYIAAPGASLMQPLGT